MRIPLHPGRRSREAAGEQHPPTHATSLLRAAGPRLAPAAVPPRQPRIAPQLAAAAAGTGGGGRLTRPPLGWEVSQTKLPG